MTVERAGLPGAASERAQSVGLAHRANSCGWLSGVRGGFSALSSDCQKIIFKIALSICSAMSEFIENKVFNKISLDLIPEEQTRSTILSSFGIGSAILEPHVFRKFKISSSSPGRYEASGIRTQQEGLDGTMFHLTRF